MVPSVEQEIRDLHELFGSSRDPEGRAFVPLADAYRRAGDPGRALELLEEGLRRHPHLPSAHLVEALTRVDLFDHEGAEAAYHHVLAADPDNARALVGLGRLLAERGDDDGEGGELVRRGLALDPELEHEAPPVRTPRIDASAAAPSVAEVASLLEWDRATGHDGLGPVDAPDAPLPEPDVATPPEVAARRTDDDDVFDLADLAPSEMEEIGDLDIVWESEGFYGAVDEPEPEGFDEVGGEAASEGFHGAVDGPEPKGPDEAGGEAAMAGVHEVADEFVLDAASLAPDDWADDAPASGPGALPTGEVDADGLLMELADLAPDIEPGSRPDEDDAPDEVLPTRTLGELYARQGLVDEAVKVFEELVRHAPSDDGLHARLAELRAQVGPLPGAEADVDAADDADEPPIAEFFARLLAWEPTAPDPGADLG